MDDSQKLIWYEKQYGPIIEERGLKNWRNLFRKPTSMELIVFFMLVMMLFVAWAYNRDIQVCREYIKQQNQYQIKNLIGNINNISPVFNITFKEGTIKEGVS
jgi:hypothetical protein